MLKKYLKFKKSAIEVSLIHLLEVILAITMVMILIYFSLKLTGFLLSGREYSSTINNLEALSERINEMIKDKKDSLTTNTIYSIMDDYILVGFSYNDNSIRNGCTEENIVKSRPNLCQSKSCLCIYRNQGSLINPLGRDFDIRGDVTPLKCNPFEQKIVFLTHSQDSNFRGTESQIKSTKTSQSFSRYLVLYGVCGGPWKTSWGIRPISVEKQKEGENIFIFIDEYKKSS